jgi:hypothetical protein
VDVFSVSTIELSSNHGYSLGNRKIIICGFLPDGTPDVTCAKIVTAAERGEPVAGTIGDIQGSTAESFLSPTPTSFAFDPTICWTVMSSDISRFFCQKAGANNVVDYPYLPEQIGSITWDVTADGVVGTDLSPGPLLLTITTPNAVSVIQTLTKICPVAEFDKISGCYDCDEGFVVHIDAYSTCLEGAISLTVDDSSVTLIMGSIMLTREKTEFKVLARSAKKYVDFKVTLSTYTDKTSVSVTGLLEDPAVKIKDTQLVQAYNGTSLTDKITMWNWSQKLGFIFGMVILFISICLICSCLVYCYAGTCTEFCCRKIHYRKLIAALPEEHQHEMSDEKGLETVKSHAVSHSLDEDDDLTEAEREQFAKEMRRSRLLKNLGTN